MVYRVFPTGAKRTFTTEAMYAPTPKWIKSGLNSSRYFGYQELLRDPTHTCHTYKAAKQPAWVFPSHVVVTEPACLTDIFFAFPFFYVSEAFRQVVEKLDQLEHQFWPVDLVDEQGKSVGQQTYYVFNMRRYLDVPPLQDPNNPGIVELEPAGYRASRECCKLKSSLRLLPELKAYVEQQPIWARAKEERELFLSETLYHALCAANLSGLRLYEQAAMRFKERTSVQLVA